MKLFIVYERVNDYDFDNVILGIFNQEEIATTLLLSLDYKHVGKYKSDILNDKQTDCDLYKKRFYESREKWAYIVPTELNAYDSAIQLECAELTKTYSELDIKQIYADLIEQIGHDAGAVCHWEGVDSISLDEWKKAWWAEFNSHVEYERENGSYHERARIAAELLKINQDHPN